MTVHKRRSRPPRRAGRPTPDQTEKLDGDIREAALRLFLDCDYDGTSMDAIAKAGGTTKVTLYSRFNSKEELFGSVLWWALTRRNWPRPEPRQPDMDDLRGSLWAVAVAANARATDPSMVKLSRIAATHALRFPDIARRVLQAGTSTRYQYVIELLKFHAAKGAIVAEQPAILAEHFLAMVSGAPARLAAFGIDRDHASQQQRLRIALELFLRGLQPS